MAFRTFTESVVLVIQSDVRTLLNNLYVKIPSYRNIAAQGLWEKCRDYVWIYNSYLSVTAHVCTLFIQLVITRNFPM